MSKPYIPNFFRAMRGSEIHYGTADEIGRLVDVQGVYIAKTYYTRGTDGLSQSWQTDGAVWCNPPYGKDIIKWVRKAYHESMGGQTIVMLIPARVDTRWFHDYVYHKAKIVFLRGRLHYGRNGVPSHTPAAFPSMIVIYNGRG